MRRAASTTHVKVDAVTDSAGPRGGSTPEDKFEINAQPVTTTRGVGARRHCGYDSNDLRLNACVHGDEGHSNGYEVRNNATNNVKSVHGSVLHRVYDRKLSQSSGAGRGMDAVDVTMGRCAGRTRPSAGAATASRAERRRRAGRARPTAGRVQDGQGQEHAGCAVQDGQGQDARRERLAGARTRRRGRQGPAGTV